MTITLIAKLEKEKEKNYKSNVLAWGYGTQYLPQLSQEQDTLRKV
jgi:hypothetical protein